MADDDFKPVPPPRAATPVAAAGGSGIQAPVPAGRVEGRKKGDRHRVGEPAPRKSPNRPKIIKEQLDALLIAMETLSKAEMERMRAIYNVLKPLPAGQRKRVLHHAARLLGVTDVP